MTLSDGFLETNNCSNYLAVGGSCSISIQFVPVVAGTVSGSLAIDGDAVNTPYSISLTGNSTTTASLTSDLQSSVFSSDLNNLVSGTVLTTQQIKDEFSSITSGIANNASQGVTAVADPAGSGRGNVLRVFFPKGQYGNSASGAAWQTKIPARDEYYFAYDIYVPAGFNWPLGLRFPVFSAAIWAPPRA